MFAVSYVTDHIVTTLIKTVSLTANEGTVILAEKLFKLTFGGSVALISKTVSLL